MQHRGVARCDAVVLHGARFACCTVQCSRVAQCDVFVVILAGIILAARAMWRHVRTKHSHGLDHEDVENRMLSPCINMDEKKVVKPVVYREEKFDIIPAVPKVCHIERRQSGVILTCLKHRG